MKNNSTHIDISSLMLHADERETKKAHYNDHRDCWNCRSKDVEYRIQEHLLHCLKCGEQIPLSVEGTKERLNRETKTIEEFEYPDYPPIKRVNTALSSLPFLLLLVALLIQILT